MKNYFGILGWAAQRKLSIHIYYFKIIFLFGQAFMCIKNQRASVGFAPWTQRVGLPTGVLKAGPWPGPHSRAWPNFTENYLKTSSWFQKGIYLSMAWHTHPHFVVHLFDLRICDAIQPIGSDVQNQWSIYKIKVTCTYWDIIFENGLKTQEFICNGNIFELFYLHKTNSACICAGKTPLNRTLCPMSHLLDWIAHQMCCNLLKSENLIKISQAILKLWQFEGH